MIKVLKSWIDRFFSDPEAILLVAILIGGVIIIKNFGQILTPLFISIAIAMLLQIFVNMLDKYKMLHGKAYLLVYLIFFGLFLGSLLFLAPLLGHQLINFLTEMPVLIQNGRTAIIDFMQTKHQYVSTQFLETVFSGFAAQSQEWGHRVISFSLASIHGLISLIVYLILVPWLVFLFMRDHKAMLSWSKKFLPKKSGFISQVWFEMQDQVGNYVIGKLVEVVIVSIFTYLVFLFFHLRYPALLAFIVGLSAIIPFVGIVLATIPVVLVGYFQWGFTGGLTGEFALMLYSYAFIQLVDGSILVPLLFSEAVNLHPVAIIMAILFFGYLWGFWGVFFAIPLATLVKALINAWPQHRHLAK